jgi:hypothetical protein
MPPTELRKTIEDEFDSWDTEFQQRKQTFLDTQNLRERLRQEKEQISRSLDETVAKFDELLNLLDKEHVIFPSGENLNECNYQKILELSRVIYEESMFALHLTRDHDFIENPQLRALKDNPELNKFIPISSLKRKVKAHFILAELYAALGVRIDPELEDRCAIKEYRTVIEEGKMLFKRLQKKGNGFLENSLVSSAYNVGASYKRLFDLFVEAEEKDPKKYGRVTTGERSVLHDYVKYSKEWYDQMFDIVQESKDPLNLEKVFHTDYEFKRYLHDIECLNLGCIFQSYQSETLYWSPERKRDEKDLETEDPKEAKFFTCSKTGMPCEHNNTEGNYCSYPKDTIYYGGLIARVEIMRDLF